MYFQRTARWIRHRSERGSRSVKSLSPSLSFFLAKREKNTVCGLVLQQQQKPAATAAALYDTKVRVIQVWGVGKKTKKKKEKGTERVNEVAMEHEVFMIGPRKHRGGKAGAVRQSICVTKAAQGCAQRSGVREPRHSCTLSIFLCTHCAPGGQIDHQKERALVFDSQKWFSDERADEASRQINCSPLASLLHT